MIFCLTKGLPPFLRKTWLTFRAAICLPLPHPAGMGIYTFHTPSQRSLELLRAVREKYRTTRSVAHIQDNCFPAPADGSGGLWQLGDQLPFRRAGFL
jgi:hypothetical protein